MINTFASKYKDRLREYYYVGGMPEVVQSYVNDKDFGRVRDSERSAELLPPGFFQACGEFFGSPD